MNFKEYKINGISIVEIQEPGVIIECAQDFLDIVSDACAKRIILKKENICEEFYDLQTGVALSILQKASNYRLYLGIIGDFSNIESKSLRDFIFESNNTKQILFKATVEEVLKIFSRKPKSA